jgi:predicted RNase H-like nuclease (RuvC/YqgF family)
MANVLARVQEAIDLFNRARTAMVDVTATITDGREAINETRLDRLQEQLKREEMETKAARDDLASAIAEYRKRRNG